MRGYTSALQAAGCEVLDTWTFGGNYQGVWLARVKHGDSEGWITGWYGTCSSCDHFAEELGYDRHRHSAHGDLADPWLGYYDLSEHFDEDCEQCVAMMARLKRFGEEYLPPRSVDEITDELLADTHWIFDEREMAAVIAKHCSGDRRRALLERLGAE